ncbi:Peptidase family M48 [Hyella patelloides LEGE 07179]|uniref:Peptidase family M48 n=1 Tax=Hyella patelloides LEGE 07179 TaxID=945734 RepID=A0A563VVB9_9CYAN|nr:M48 family metallopeptidase [Hyella patelloides]VEP15347.1 Peptidase family M48 [Hyella patelloides LEGE 07179]
MKLYLNLLCIFFSLFYFSGVAVAELSLTEEETKRVTKVNTEEVENNNNVDSVPETTTAEPAKNDNELSKIFPGCPLVEETVPTVIVETKIIEETVTEATQTEEINANVEDAISNDTSIEKNESTEVTPTESVSPDVEEAEETTDRDSTPKETAETDSEVASQEKKCPTPEEIARYQKFAEADSLYLAGEKVAAAKIYQELKEPWDREHILNNQSKPIYKPEELSPGGKVYWRTYQQGKKQQLESKIFTPLELLVKKDPEFIPGHIAYTEELMAIEKEAKAYGVMERAIGLYPNEVQLLRAKIDTDVQGERWLEASISARQFALFNPDIPEAEEFTLLADRYLEKYQDEIEEELTWNAIGNAITGAAGFALTGNLFGPISAIDTTIMLLQGESNLGDRFAKRARKQLPMVEDEEVLNYVQKIGNKIASVAGRDDFEYEFFVIMDDSLNAFALPGGKVFVNAGAIMKTDSEAELAGLLAHEVAHSVLSHGFQLVTRGNLTSNVTQYIPYVGSTAGSLIVMNYSRDMERQADVFGTRILVAADYAADGVRNLMAKLGESNAENEEYQEPPAWLSTHPNTDKRVSYIEELVISNNLNRYAYEGVIEHQKIKQKTQQLWQEYQAEKEAKKKDDESD